MSKHTPGPWFADDRGYVWRRSLAELYEYGGGVAGDKPLAAVHKGWCGEDVTGYPVKANTQLMAAAPDLLEACQTLVDLPGTEDWLFTLEKAVDQARAAIAKATGEQHE